MAIMNSLRRFGFLTGASATVAGFPLAAQETYPQTLYWGVGLIDIPVAWVPPLTGDFAINYSAKRFEQGNPAITKINYTGRSNAHVTLSLSAFGRVEYGVALYSSDPVYGFFGQALVLDERQFRKRPGSWFIPSIALGFRGIGPYDQIDRFGMGYSVLPPAPGSPNDRYVADTVHRDFDVTPTVYGVGTKSFSLADVRSGWPGVNLSMSIGYGNGLFSNDGGLGDAYAKHSTGGVFGGVKLEFVFTSNAGLTLMAENNAWDYNVGASFDWHGVRGGVYWTELGTGPQEPADNASRARAARQLYNYRKVAFTLGFQGNLDVKGGKLFNSRRGELNRRRESALSRLGAQRGRIVSVEAELANEPELERRRALEDELQRARQAAVKEVRFVERTQAFAKRTIIRVHAPPGTRVYLVPLYALALKRDQLSRPSDEYFQGQAPGTGVVEASVPEIAYHAVGRLGGEVQFSRVLTPRAGEECVVRIDFLVKL
jgi:hypothetical protein